MRHLARKAIPVLPAAPAGSLAAALAAIPDGRAPFGWRPGRSPLPLVAVLQVSVAALLCGAQSLAAIAQWSRERLEDAPALLLALGLPPGRTPSVATLHRLFKTLDVAAFEQALAAWVCTPDVSAGEALAVDGKTLRGAAHAEPSSSGELPPLAHLVAVYAHEAQVVIAQVASAGKGHELAAVQRVLGQVPLAGRVVTADALSTQRAVCQQIVQARGAYVLPVKENQPTLLADCQAAFSPVERDGIRRAGPAERARMAPAGDGAARGDATRGGPNGSQGAPWPPGGPAALGAGGPAGERASGGLR